MNASYLQILFITILVSVTSCDAFTEASPDRFFTKNIGLEGTELARVIRKMPDGGLFIAGRSNSLLNNDDMYLIKMDSEYGTVWSKTIGSKFFDEITDAAINNDNDIIVTGTISISSTDRDIYIGKFNQTGDLLWSRNIGSAAKETGIALRLTPTEDIVWVADVDASSGMPNHILVGKMNTFGQTMWTLTYHDSLPIEPYNIALLDDGGIVVTGYVSMDSPYLASGDAFLFKINSSGNPEWFKRYHHADDAATLMPINRNRGYAVAQSIDGSIVMFASSQVSSAHTGHLDTWFVKTDLDGNITSENTYREIYTEDAFPELKPAACAVTDDGGFIITGRQYNKLQSSTHQLWLAKITPTGELIWSRTYGDAQDDEGLSLDIIPDGIVVAGFTTLSDSTQDIYFLKLTGDGNLK